MAAVHEELPEDMLDEVWRIMHMVAEMGAHPGTHTYTEKKFLFECELETDSGVEEPSDEREHAMIDAADALTRMGDDYNKREHREDDHDALVREISFYLLGKSHEINEKWGKQLSTVRPKDIMFETGVFGSVYSMFRMKMEEFLGVDQGVDKIALVSRVTQGVANSFKDSSSSAVHLATALSYKFITDKYGSFIQSKGGLTKLVSGKDSDPDSTPSKE